MPSLSNGVRRMNRSDKAQRVIEALTCDYRQEPCYVCNSRSGKSGQTSNWQIFNDGWERCTSCGVYFTWGLAVYEDTLVSPEGYSWTRDEAGLIGQDTPDYDFHKLMCPDEPLPPWVDHDEK